MNILQRLKQLDIAAQELDTGNPRRSGEINNLRCGILLLIETILDGDEQELQEILPVVVDIKTRINHLAENLDSCGKHDLIDN